MFKGQLIQWSEFIKITLILQKEGRMITKFTESSSLLVKCTLRLFTLLLYVYYQLHRNVI